MASVTRDNLSEQLNGNRKTETSRPHLIIQKDSQILKSSFPFLCLCLFNSTEYRQTLLKVISLIQFAPITVLENKRDGQDL